MAKCKYNNGGLVAKKDFKGIGSIEGSFGGTQAYQSGHITGSAKVGGARASASMFKDSMGNKSKSYSLEKTLKLPNRATVNVKLSDNPKVTYTKNIGKGFTFEATANRKSAAMRISKPL